MKKVLVIGDSCKDKFVYCSSTRLCPDVPVPILNIVDEKENDGMAMNLRHNVYALGIECEIITNYQWHKVIKTRYMHQESNHMFVRIDAGHETIKRINTKTLNVNGYDMLSEYDLIAISDYDKGFLQKEDIEYICGHHSNVFVDTKKILGPWISSAKYIKINTPEYFASKHVITRDIEDKIIRTDGGDGCYFRETHYPVKKVEVIDVSGAGDTFFAGLVVNYVKTNNINSAIVFANECASKVVQHKGVTVINNCMLNT